MIQHVVVAPARPDATEADLDELVAAWRKLPDRIPGVERLTAGRDLGLGDGRFAVASVAEFATVEAWRVFMAHPEHAAIRTLATRVLDRERLAVVQFER